MPGRWVRAAFVSDGANNRVEPGNRSSRPATKARCRLPVASTAITGPTGEACANTIRSTWSTPAPDTGTDLGCSSQPEPSLTQTRFVTFPGSTATTTVDGSKGAFNTAMSPPSERTHHRPPSQASRSIS